MSAMRVKLPKYRAQPTVIDGVRFHSKGEAARWWQLRMLERAGTIRALARQKALTLHVVRETDVIVIGKYVADFTYFVDGLLVYEDFKGFDTPLAKWKRKHCEAEYGITIRITR